MTDMGTCTMSQSRLAPARLIPGLDKLVLTSLFPLREALLEFGDSNQPRCTGYWSLFTSNTPDSEFYSGMVILHNALVIPMDYLLAIAMKRAVCKYTGGTLGQTAKY